MASWNAQFESHLAWKKLYELESELVRIRPFISQDSSQLDSYTRLNELTASIERAKKELSPSLTAQAYLKKIEDFIESVLTNLRGKSEEEARQAVENAARSVDVAVLDFIFYENNKPSESKAMESVAYVATDLLKTLEQKVKAQDDKLNQLEQKLLEKQNEVNALKDQAIKEFSDLKISEQDKFIELVQDMDRQGKSAVNTLDERLKEAQNIVGIISNHGMVGGYQRTANNERTAKWIWQGITTVALLSLIYFAVTHLVSVTEWTILVPRFLVAASFIALASYAGIQAERHRRSETQNRRLELGIASIDPFLSSLTAQERDKLKETLVSKLFDQPDDGEVKSGVPEINIDILERLKKVFG